MRTIDYDFNSPPKADGLYRVLYLSEDEDESSPYIGEEVIFGSEDLYANGIVVSKYEILVVEHLRWRK